MTGQYRVTYIAEEWSLPWARDMGDQTSMHGDRVDCGEWATIEMWNEGSLPGTYEFVRVLELNETADPFLLIVGGPHPAFAPATPDVHTPQRSSTP